MGALKILILIWTKSPDRKLDMLYMNDLFLSTWVLGNFDRNHCMFCMISNTCAVIFSIGKPILITTTGWLVNKNITSFDSQANYM